MSTGGNVPKTPSMSFVQHPALIDRNLFADLEQTPLRQSLLALLVGVELLHLIPADYLSAIT
jgi:hypothetical protein